LEQCEGTNGLFQLKSDKYRKLESFDKHKLIPASVKIRTDSRSSRSFPILIFHSRLE